MRSLSMIILVSVLSINARSQELLKKSEVNYSEPMQVDSSVYFLIPKLIGNENRNAYGKGKGYLPWGNYSEIYFYNSATRESKKLFGGQLAIITAFGPGRNWYYYYRNSPEIPHGILDNHIIYLARTENYNNDNGLDSEDPVYLYISTKTGDKLTQITPKGVNVISWNISKDKKMILVKTQHDKTGNKKFGNGDDEFYYRIDLDDNISKIKCTQILF
jgi:hypothetical protein